MNKYDNPDACSLLLKILVSKTRQLNCLEKYFLIRVIHFHGVDSPVVKSIDILSPSLGITAINISKAKASLASKGVLSTESVSSGPGRPTHGFCIHLRELIVLLDNQDNQDNQEKRNKQDEARLKMACRYHVPFILSLLCWGDGQEDRCRDLGVGEHVRSKRAFLSDEIHDLHSRARMLNAVLLAHADEHGFVDSLGQTDLMTMAGLTKDQLRYQVKELKKKGYIRSEISGFTNAKIFGVTPSVYCLNTHKAGIPSNLRLNFTLFRETHGRQAHKNNEAAQLLAIACKTTLPIKAGGQKRKQQVVSVRALVGTRDPVVLIEPNRLSLLCGTKSASFCCYLQYRLETYACWFLSLPGFNDDKRGINNPEYQKIVDKISSEISCKSKYPSFANYTEVSTIFGEISLVMAKTYFQFLQKYNPNALDATGAVYRVFPRLIPRFEFFKSDSIAIACYDTSPKTVRQQSEVVYVRDDRIDIANEVKRLFNLQKSGEIDELEYNQSLNELSGTEDFSIINTDDEAEINQFVRLKCGLISPTDWKM